MHGPAHWRSELTEVLENLVEGRESQADLDKMNNALFTIYYRKKPKDEYEAIDQDFHLRMAKEIRRRQYDVGVREKSRSKSPKRRPAGQIYEPVPEAQRSNVGVDEMLGGLGKIFKTYHSPNTDKPQASVVINDNENGPNGSNFSDIDTTKKTVIDEDPLKATHTGAGVPVRVQRAPNPDDPFEDDMYEELLNERWQRRVRAVKGKIKNFLTEFGVTKEMVEDCLDTAGKQYFRPIVGNLKRKNHPNVIPSVFLMMEELQGIILTFFPKNFHIFFSEINPKIFLIKFFL